MDARTKAEPELWIAAAAHALARQWPHVPLLQLEEVATALKAADALAALQPGQAVAQWLASLEQAGEPRKRA